MENAVGKLADGGSSAHGVSEKGPELFRCWRVQVCWEPREFMHSNESSPNGQTWMLVGGYMCAVVGACVRSLLLFLLSQ